MARGEKSHSAWNDYIQANFAAPTIAWMLERGYINDDGGILLPSRYWYSYFAREKPLPGYDRFDVAAKAMFKDKELRKAIAANEDRLAQIRAKKRREAVA